MATRTDTPVDAAPKAANPSPAVDANDINDWCNRVNNFLDGPTEAAAVANANAAAEKWHTNLFGCCTPFETCCMTSCCPCITFGKTYHRMNKDSTMKGYSPINMTCLLFCIGQQLLCVPLLFATMQRGDLRKKHNIAGSTFGDICTSCCCMCCSLVQTEKESEYRAKQELVTEQPGRQVEMMNYAPVPEPEPRPLVVDARGVTVLESEDVGEVEQGTVRRGKAPGVAA
ncbi:hypothetical protein H2201_006936 [Coniosporium apollinis]|uniref:PLAC8 family protein n=1 Tax=Coniosporium apollinis TaxID=61459 RepID=A0ABQ9NS14_9PEZI|nr:hypothetical protein H2201_006936 [Coniosporium apollinis]